MDELLIFLPLIVLTGLLSCYYDIKKGIIPNKLTGLMIFLGIIIHSVLIFINKNELNYDFVLTTITNNSCAVILAFWWWKIKWWYGGDAKLFLTYAILIPISTYRFGYINYFPSLILLINTFLPISLLFLFETLKKPSKIKIKPILVSSLNIFALSQIPILLGIENWILFFLSILIMAKLLDIIPYGIIIQSILAITRLTFDNGIWTLSFWEHFMFWTLMLLAAKQIISEKSEYLVHKEQSHEGSIIAEEITLGKRTIPKDTLLNKQDAGLINRTILEYDTLPFAPCLFIGVLITIFAKGIFLMLINFK